MRTKSVELPESVANAIEALAESEGREVGQWLEYYVSLGLAIERQGRYTRAELHRLVATMSLSSSGLKIRDPEYSAETSRGPRVQHGGRGARAVEDLMDELATLEHNPAIRQQLESQAALVPVRDPEQGGVRYVNGGK